ncbi:hypothetical protein BH20ACT5_BH20ACT5_23860 [soil metagenome]
MDRQSRLTELLSQAAPHLGAGEPIVAAVFGMYDVTISGRESRRAGILFGTDHRLVLFGTKKSGFDLTALRYDDIQAVEQVRDAWGTTATFVTADELIVFGHMADADFAGFAAQVGERLELLEATARS